MARQTRQTPTQQPPRQHRTRCDSWRHPDGWSRLVAAILAAEDHQSAAVADLVPIRRHYYQ